MTDDGDNEKIESDEEKEGDKEEESDDMAKENETGNEDPKVSDSVDDDDGNDDDESEVDLADIVAQMEENDVEENCAVSVVPPKTEHELDPYRTPVSELERYMKFSFTVEGKDRLRLGSADSVSQRNLAMAGRIRSHMVNDRTVVVESFEGCKALDEGSLLVLRLEGCETDQQVVPLGRIFEVFGPVSQPLYTIRLPPPPPIKGESKGKKEGIKVPSKIPETGKSKEDASPDKPTEEMTQMLIAEQSSGSDPLPEAEQPECSGEGFKISPDIPDSSAPVNHQNSASAVVDTNKGPEAETKQEEISVKNVDPWVDGEFARLFKSNQSTNVYYVVDEAKLIDTTTIMRTSGKGCDASNLYDEEVVNVSEMYFSDDEEERQAKSRRKPGGSGDSHRRDSQQNPSGWSQPRPQGFQKHQPRSQTFQSQPRPLAPIGFHPTPVQDVMQRPPPGFYQPHYQPYPPSQAVPHPQLGNSGYGVPSMAGIPPPPPPPPPVQQARAASTHTTPYQAANNPQPTNAFYYDYS